MQATIAGPNMKSEINRLQSSGTPCRAFIMGTRRTDPHGAALQVARALPPTDSQDGIRNTAAAF
jgi:hypothetical protein